MKAWRLRLPAPPRSCACQHCCSWRWPLLARGWCRGRRTAAPCGFRRKVRRRPGGLAGWLAGWHRPACMLVLLPGTVPGSGLLGAGCRLAMGGLGCAIIVAGGRAEWVLSCGLLQAPSPCLQLACCWRRRCWPCPLPWSTNGTSRARRCSWCMPGWGRAALQQVLRGWRAGRPAAAAAQRSREAAGATPRVVAVVLLVVVVASRCRPGQRQRLGHGGCSSSWVQAAGGGGRPRASSRRGTTCNERCAGGPAWLLHLVPACI